MTLYTRYRTPRRRAGDGLAFATTLPIPTMQPGHTPTTGDVVVDESGNVWTVQSIDRDPDDRRIARYHCTALAWPGDLGDPPRTTLWRGEYRVVSKHGRLRALTVARRDTAQRAAFAEQAHAAAGVIALGMAALADAIEGGE